MDENSIYVALADVFHAAFPDQDIKLHADLTAMDVDGWDSIKHVEIIILVQKKFGIRMRSREIDALNTVGDLVRVVSSHVKQSESPA